jgi:CubicO group peptidase (beta-lactamase class C family)
MSNNLPRGLGDALDYKMSREFGRHKLTGLSVGLVVDGELGWSQGYGYADLESERAPDADTVFRVGSITKTFTATGIFQLRDQGNLSIDDPLTKFIPEFEQAEAKVGSIEQVTLRRMMCHRSGLMGESPGDYWETLNFPTIQEFIDKLSEVAIVIEPDSAFKYSNLAFALLGEVVSRVSGRPYDDYIRENILNPLGMSFSDFQLTSAVRENVATGYQPRPHEDYPDIAPHPDLNGHISAGQLYSSVADLAKWIGFQADSKNESVLSGKSKAEMQRPQFLESGWRGGFCLPWFAHRLSDHVYLGHGGGVHGFLTEIFFDPERNIGAIALTNSDGHDANSPIMHAIFDTYNEAMNSTARASDLSRPTPTPPELRQYLGSYSTVLGGTLSIEYRSENLVLDMDPHSRGADSKIRLDPTDNPDVYIVTGDRYAGEELRFNRNPEGTVVGFHSAGFPARKLVEA